MHEPSFIPTQFMNSSTKESLYVTLGAAENVANNKISEMSFTSGLVSVHFPNKLGPYGGVLISVVTLTFINYIYRGCTFNVRSNNYVNHQ